MYMGEIVRLIILDLMQQDLLFIGQRDHYGDYKTPLFTRGGFYTKFVSTVETDVGIAFANTRRVLEDMGIRNPTFDDCAIIQHICKNVSKRAAKLSGACKYLFESYQRHSALNLQSIRENSQSNLDIICFIKHTRSL